MKTSRTREWTIDLTRPGRKNVCGLQEDTQAARVPRLARLMALAIRFDGLLRSGAIIDQARLARLGKVSRARISQILNLLHLAPDIQEQLLFLPPLHQGRERLYLADLQPLFRQWNWPRQRRMWQALLSCLNKSSTTDPQ
jgi:hypothetical protein